MESTNQEEEAEVRELYANGIFMKTNEVEGKLDEGNVQDAEDAVKEKLSVNSEEARALLAQLQFIRGNYEDALRILDGSELGATQQTAGVVLTALYVKTKSLQKLGRFTEAANECKGILGAVEKLFKNGIPDRLMDTKLQETISQAVELLPELWKQASEPHEAIGAYRRALLSQWNLDNDCCARIQKKFAVFLLYSGMEATPPSLSVEIDGAFMPKNNLEEGILLLMIVLRKCSRGKTKFDPSVIEHLTFALAVCGQTSVLPKQLEELMPGTLSRGDRWNSLALCLCAAGGMNDALNLLRKSLHKHERPDDLVALLLAAMICSTDPYLASEGASYAERAVANAQGTNEHLKGVGLHMLGLCLVKQAKLSSSDLERSNLQTQALRSLEEALVSEGSNPDLLFDLGAHYAEQRNLTAAMLYAKQYIDATGGSMVKGWRLLVLILSAKQRFAEAQVIIDAALDETVKWEQKPLLKMNAKLKSFQSLPAGAIETYKYLLALVEAQRKSAGPLLSIHQVGFLSRNYEDVFYLGGGFHLLFHCGRMTMARRMNSKFGMI
ncbi:hypothetical protein Droror1_Dr00012946 [Drosera rotundifolia]